MHGAPLQRATREQAQPAPQPPKPDPSQRPHRTLVTLDRKLAPNRPGYDQHVVEVANVSPAVATEPAVETGLLSVIIPVYNEEHHVAEVIRRVRDVPLPKEIIVVDDGSTDRTLDELERERDSDGDLVVVH